MDLNEWFKTIKDRPGIPLPEKCLVINDLHASSGGENDPLVNGGVEAAILEHMKQCYVNGYSLLVSEVFDVWRGGSLGDIYAAHEHLVDYLDMFDTDDRLYHVLGNHERDRLYRPEFFIFEGYGIKLFYEHGCKFDWPNCEGWRIGRFAVQAAATLGIDPESSPHPANTDRHLLVRRLRRELAEGNPDWTFLHGHTHSQEKILGNLYDSGCGHHGEFIEIIEGEVILHAV